MKSGTTFLGASEHVTIAFAYALGWLTGLIVLLAEKNNENVRYHGAQSVMVFGGITLLNLALTMVPLLGLSYLLLNLLSLATVVAWIVFVVTALNKKALTVDPIKDYADQLRERVKV